MSFAAALPPGLLRWVPREGRRRPSSSILFPGGKRPEPAGRCRSSVGTCKALQGNGEVGAGAPVPCRSALLARSGRLPLPWVNDHLDFMVAFIPRLFSVSFSPHSPCAHLSPCSCHPFPSLVPRHTSWHRRLLGSGLSAASLGLRAGCPLSGCGVTMGGDPPAVLCPARCLPPLSLTAVPFFLLQLD